MYTLHSQFLKTPLFKITPLSQTTPIKPSLLSQPHLPRSPTPILSPIRSSGDGGQGGSEDGPPPDMVEIRFRRGSRRRQREQEGNYGTEQLNTTKPTQPPKSWEEMTFQEKALELYVGEKGLLFWLNKFAYASIYIIIGGWILFRFVGPALNLYQLDAPPLPPTAIFKS